MRILVVEDTPKHMQDALEAAKSFDIEVVTSTSAEDAGRKLGKIEFSGDAKTFVPAVDGVITDLFMPFRNRRPYDGADQACGLSVAVQAATRGIPFIICTAGYHHGHKYQWVCDLGRQLGWPEMVDSSNDYTQEAETKNWKRAFELLLGFINRE